MDLQVFNRWKFFIAKLCILVIYLIIASNSIFRYFHKYRYEYVCGFIIVFLFVPLFHTRRRFLSYFSWAIITPYIASIFGYLLVIIFFAIEHGYFSKTDFVSFVIIIAFMPYVASLAWGSSIMLSLLYFIFDIYASQKEVRGQL